MPDKISPSQFAARVKEKYPEYKSYDDSTLVDAVLKKYPEYKENIDFGSTTPMLAQTPKKQEGLPTFQQQQETLQQVQSKYDKAVQDDRSRVGKLAATVYNGLVSSGEALAGFGAEVFGELATRIPSPQYDIAGNKLGTTIYDLSPEQQAKAKKELKKSVREGFDVLKSGYVTKEEEKQIQGKFDITNGIGLDDFEGLAAMSGRIAGDIGLAAATGGSSYFMQGYSDAVDDYDEAAAKMGIKENPNARALYGVAGGTINGLLEKFAIDKLVGDGPVFKAIQKKAIANVLKNTSNMTGKAAIEGIENFAKEEIKKLTSDLKSKGLKAGYRALVEGGTEGLQAALEDGAKFATNWAQGVDAFNEKEVKDQFFKNILNSAAAGAVFGPVIGFGMDKTFGKNINTQVLDDIANAKTPEDLDRINQELQTTFDSNNFSDAERQMVMDNARRYAEVKQTLPADTPPSAQMIAIPKIENRIKLDNEIKNRQTELESIDESLRPSYEQDIALLQDKRASLNDEIREIITGDKFQYTEENGKFYKTSPDGKKDEISRNRYDLEQIKLEDNATTEGQRPIQEGGTAGDISQRQGTQEGRAQKAPSQADTRYRNISSEKAVGIPSFLGMTVTYKLPNRKITGTLIQEGQTLSVEDENGDVVAELGNIDELSNMSPEEMNLTVVEPNVELTENGFSVDGKELFNENENPFDAVSVDQNGNVMNVVLTTSGGKRRKFRGRVAQKLAEQIGVKEDQRLAAEDQKLQQEFAIPTPKAPKVITTQPTIAKITEDNLYQIDTIPGSTLQKKVLANVKPVVKAIGAAVKNITGSPVSVNIHDKKSFADAVIEAGGTQQDSTSRGFYMADDGSIHLNMDALASDTMLHEGFHPILDILEKYNPEIINELFTELESIPEASDIIAQAKENYEGDVTQKKEAITDFVAGVADGRIVLNPSNFQKIKNFILNMLNKIGIGQGGSTLMNVNNEQDLVKLAQFITEKFTTGEQITLEALDLITGSKQYESGDGLDIQKDLPQDTTGKGPQFSKDTLEEAKRNRKSVESLKGTKISRVVFYDITRVGKLAIKNILNGYTPDVDGKGGPFYSYMDSSIKNKAVLAFVSINQAIQSLQRQLLYPDGVHAIAAQNPLTAHLGNKSTLAALFGQGIGIFQNAAKTKAQESEIVKTLVSEVDRISKMEKGEAKDAVVKILKTVDLKSIKTIDQFRDNILLGEGDSFGSRGAILGEILQNKQTKITANTRDSHKILHYKYGIPTIADIAQGNNQEELSNAELGDVIKLVKPSTELVIYTTSQEQFDRYSKKPTPEMKKAGIRIELLEEGGHESYPFVLAGENVALLDNYVSAAQLFERFKSLKKSQTFFRVGRMKKYAEAGMIPQDVVPEATGPKFQKLTKSEKQKRTDTASEKLKQLFNRDNIPLSILEAKDIINEVIDWTTWYDGISDYVKSIFNEYAEDVLSLLPLSSMANNSAATVGLAINNVEKIYKGEKPSGVAEYYGYVTDFLKGKGIESDKMYNFFKALSGDKNAIAVDMHVWSIIMGKDHNKKQVNPKNKAEFDKAKEFVNIIANELGLAPREVQAALWAANILRTGGKPDSYEQYIEKQVREKGLKERIQGWRDKGYKPFSEVRKAREAVRAEGKEPQFQRLAPNGKPSNLNEQQYNQVRTPEFKNWFGDWENDTANSSKVVDENGEPLVVYHGSASDDIEIFDRQKAKRVSSGLLEFGTYFTNNKELAKLYASAPLSEDSKNDIKKRISELDNQLDRVRNNREYGNIMSEIDALENKLKGKAGRIYEVFLNLKKVKEFDGNGESGVSAWRNLQVDAGYKIANNRDAMLFLKEGKFGVEKVDGVVAKNISDVSEFATEETKKKTIGTVYLVFDGDANKIKSATENTGDFSIKDNRIQFQKSPTKTEKSTVKRFAKDQFLIGGILGKDVLKLKEQMSGGLSDEMTKAQKASTNAMKLIKKYSSVVTQKDIEDFLTGKPNAQARIPLDLAGTLSEMRAHIDNLTDRLINLGVIDDPEEVAKYQANKGKYMLRSYEIFNQQPTAMESMLLGKSKTRIDIDNVTKKLRNVDQAKVDRALEFLAKEIGKADPTLTPEQRREQAIVEANKILADTESKFAPKKYIGSTNVRSLEERLDIAPEIRALMGEYTDPVYNYYASIFKLAALTSNRKFLNDLKEEGMGKFLFTNATKDASVQIAAEKSEALKPLAGLYTFPEIKEALEQQEKMQRMLAVKFLGWTRKLKTVYNPATHVKNIIGNAGFFVSNGHWNYMDTAWKLAKNNPKEFQELMSVLRRQGVLNSSVGMGELRSYFDKHESIDDFLQSTFEKAEEKSTKGKTKEQITRIKRSAGKVTKAIEDAYQMEDDIFKIVAFVNESNRYAKARFGKQYSKLTPEQKAEIDSESSEIVKNTYPTFSRAPKFVKSLSKGLLLGNFLTFPVESVRVSYNTLKLAKDEINSGNPELKKVGMSRLIGTLAYNGIFSTLSYYFSMAGVGIGGMLGAMFDDEDEKEKREKINLLRAPWTNNSEIIPVKFSNGKLVYIDIGSLDSYSYQKKVWNAFWDNIGDEEGFKKAAFAATKQLVDPYLTLDFTYQTFKDLYDNNDESTGRKIYNPEVSGYQDKVLDVSAYLTKKLGPGVVGSAMKIYRYYNEGDAEKINSEIQSQIVRTYNTDVEKQFARYLYASRAEGNDMTDVGFKERLDDAERIYLDVKNNKGANQQQIDASYSEAIKAYKNVLGDVSKYYQAALYSGVPREKLELILYRAKLGQRRGVGEIYSIMKGVADLPDEAYIRK